MTFPFEDLTVYKLAIDWVDVAAGHAQSLKRSEFHALGDHIVRTATVIPLNIAEGSGRWHQNDKRQFFWIARGSVYESIAILAIAKRKGIVSDDAYRRGYDLLKAMAKLLTRLVQAAEAFLPSTPAMEKETEVVGMHAWLESVRT